MPRSMLRVAVVRPYGERIRARVLSLVEAAGYRVDVNDVIEEGVSDDEAIARILARGTRRLVVPYHGHRDNDGSALDGLRLLERLDAQSVGFPYRILMPVSRFGAAAVEVARAGMRDEVSSALLIVHEDELEEPTLLLRVAAHFATPR